MPFSRLRRIASSIVDVLHNRIQLLGLELREEKVRAAELVVLGVIAFFFAQLGLLLLTLALAFLFRDHAVWVLALCGLFYGMIAALCGFIVRHRLRHRPPLFSDTVAELKKDREWLSSLS